MKIDFEKSGGLVPAIIQDAQTKNVLMLGYMNEEAYTKGETSGNFLHLVDIKVDCDNDTLLVKATPDGPTCHTGTDTCWGETNDSGVTFLTELQDFIDKRHQEMPEGSYTTKLFKDGINKIAQKVGEEALETVIEATNGTDEHLVYEASDLLYHLTVLLTSKGPRSQLGQAAPRSQSRRQNEIVNFGKKEYNRMLINYKNVNIYQDSGIKVLEGVNLEVNEGEMVYVIGRVGSGKSSLLKTLYGELDVDEADEAIVLERDLKTIRRKDIPGLRRELGVVFQNFQLLSDRTVYKNLRFVLKATGWTDNDAINNRISEVMERIGLDEKLFKMPNELSGGEQQRVAIARAILNNPKLIIADEPTGNLDKETADSIMQLLKSIADTGTAVIMSTHNIGLVNKYPGKAFQCQDGKMEQVVIKPKA